MTAPEKAELARARTDITSLQNELNVVKSDVKEILEIVNEFRGGQKLLKWAITVTIAVGGVIAAFLNLFRSH
jgi:hypothetical protein